MCICKFSKDNLAATHLVANNWRKLTLTLIFIVSVHPYFTHLEKKKSEPSGIVWISAWYDGADVLCMIAPTV